MSEPTMDQGLNAWGHRAEQRRAQRGTGDKYRLGNASMNQGEPEKVPQQSPAPYPWSTKQKTAQ